MSWTLVKAAQAGDADAFGELFRIYHVQVFRFVNARVADTHTAEDLTADTFMKAWQSIGTVTDRGHDVVAWLLTIARNRVTDHHRVTVRRSELAPQVPLDERHDCVDPDASPDVAVPHQLRWPEVVGRLAGYVGALPPSQQEALWLLYGQEFNRAQVAERMECSVSSGAMYQARGRRALRARMLEDGYTSSREFIDIPTQRGAA